MDSTLIHFQVHNARVGRDQARCYWRVPVEQTTTDPTLVTCGKCRRTRAFKDALAAVTGSHHVNLSTTARSRDLDTGHDLCNTVCTIIAGPVGDREVSLMFRILPPCGMVAATVTTSASRFGVPA